MFPLNIVINFLNSLIFYICGPSEPTLRLLLTELSKHGEFANSKMFVIGDYCHYHHGVRRWAGTVRYSFLFLFLHLLLHHIPHPQSSSGDSLLTTTTSLYLMKITIHVCSHGNDSAQQLADILVEDKSGIFKKPDSNETSVVTMASPYRLGMPVNVEITASRARRETQPGYTSDMRIIQDAFMKHGKLLRVHNQDGSIPFLPLPQALLLEIVQPSCNANLVWRLSSQLRPRDRWTRKQKNMIRGKLLSLVESQGRWWWGSRSNEQWEEHLPIVDSGSHVGSPS